MLTAAPVVQGHRGTPIRLGLIRDPLPAAARGFPAFRATPGIEVSDDIWIRADRAIPILDQQAEGSCAGHAVAEGDLIEARRSNPAAAMGSRQWLYRCGRVVDGTLDRDAGAIIRSIFIEAAKVGIPPESAWPYQPKSGDADGDGLPTDQFRAEPPADLVRLAYDLRSVDGVLAAQVIDDVAGDISDNVDAALAAEHPVVIGVDVGEPFLSGDFDPAAPVELPTKTQGAHAMVIVGRRIVRANGTASRWYRVRNSWGDDFADGGRLWMSEAYMRTGDLWIVNRAPVVEAP